jgi:hypothetical protein
MLYLFLLPLLLLSCGVKTNPQPLALPVVEIKRIGNKAYVRSLQGEIQVEGFEKVGEWFVREQSSAFCFKVKRLAGRTEEFCVKKALETKPVVYVRESQDSVLVLAEGFPSYRIYPVLDSRLNPSEGVQFKEQYTIFRDYRERCYAITGEKDQRESQPYELCIAPKPPPPVEDVQRLGYQEVSGKLYIFWSYTPDELFSEFVVYKNGKLVETTQAYMYQDTAPKEKTTYTVKVRNKLGFESPGVSITYNP